jgi:glycosyltransferase involved in cell wall biosynthesis
MNNNTVAFIYQGSSGVAGGYTAKFIESFNEFKKVYAFVNVNYIYENKKSNIIIYKIFYPITDKFYLKRNINRAIIRYFELFLAYIFIFLFLLLNGIKTIIYNPVTNLKLTNIFIYLYKIYVDKLIVVVHDAQSHYDINEKYRDKIFKYADLLIFHNESSKNILYNRLKLNNKFIVIPFPWSLKKIYPNILDTQQKNTILMIGHLRPSKGALFLLESYNKYKKNNGKLRLIIKGSMSNDLFSYIYRSNNSLTVQNINLSDIDFIKEMCCAKFIIMPYKPQYSNSSVHFCSIIHSNTPFICTDIELFSNFENNLDCIKFEYGNTESFLAALKIAENITIEQRQSMVDNAYKKIFNMMNAFDRTINMYI